MCSSAKRPQAVSLLSLIPLLFLGALGLGAYLAFIPTPFIYTYLIASSLTLGVYAKDKAAARSGRRRTPERRLHLLAVAGGWPGAMLAQQWLRHKTVKHPFRLIFWLTVILNLGAAFLLLNYGLPLAI